MYQTLTTKFITTKHFIAFFFSRLIRCDLVVISSIKVLCSTNDDPASIDINRKSNS